MKALLTLVVVLGLAGCASERHIEVTSIRVSPIDLLVEVEEAQARFDSARDRYFVSMRVLKPEARRGERLHMVIDGVTEDHRSFIQLKSRWKITCDEEAFDHEKKIGFSFWTLSDLRPAPEGNSFRFEVRQE